MVTAGVCAAAGSAVLRSNKRLKHQKVDILLDGAARDACHDACADLFFACGLPFHLVRRVKLQPHCVLASALLGCTRKC